VGYGNYNEFLAKGFVSGRSSATFLAAPSRASTRSTRATITHRPQAGSDDFESRLVAPAALEAVRLGAITLIGAYIDRYDGDTGTGVALNGNTYANSTRRRSSTPGRTTPRSTPTLTCG